MAFEFDQRGRCEFLNLTEFPWPNVFRGPMSTSMLNRTPGRQNLTYQQERLFDILDHLSGNPQVVVTMITDGLIQNLPADKSKVALPSE